MRFRTLKLLVTTSVVSLLAAPALAQTAAPETPIQSTSADEEAPASADIVVTALRRETTLQKTPIAITAVTGDALAAQGIQDTSALARISPGLVLRESNLSGSRITIRNIRAAGESTVGLYYDDVPLMGSAGVNSDAGGTLPAIDLFDVERVEVLRGPQGTLYGSSSMAGTVRLILAKPDLDRLGGTFAGQMSKAEDGDFGFRTQAALNVPIIDGALGIRAVSFYRDAPGYVDNVRLRQSNINGQESRGGRVIVRARPTDTVTIDLLASAQTLDGSLNDYFLAAGAYKANIETQQPLHDRSEIYSGTIEWDAGPVTATLIASHAYRDFEYRYDFSQFFRTQAARFAVGSATYNLLNDQAPASAFSTQRTKTDTIEARIGSSGDGWLQWTAGGFYANRTGDIGSNVVRANPGDGGPLAPTGTNLLGQRLITDKLRQYAGYVETTARVAEGLSLTGGLRYFHYDRVASGEVTKVNAPIGFTPTPYTEFRTRERGVLYKANVSYQATPRLLAYATVSSGQRPGGVNQTIGLPANLVGYQSDRVRNYEVGVKTQWFDRRLTLNGDIFRIDWDDMQTSGVLPNTTFAFIANAGLARAQGIEVEATLSPMRGLDLSASGSYIDSRLLADQANQTLVAPGLKGDPIPYVPKVTAQVAGDYRWDLSDHLRGTLHADVSYSGSSWTEFRHTSEFQRFLPAFATVGIRATIGGIDDQWTLAVFATNLFDARTPVTKNSGTVYGGFDQVRAISIAPRIIGFDFSKRF